MDFKKVEVVSDVEILARSPYIAVPVTVDFTDVEGDVVKAGTPLTRAGVIANDATAEGILLKDAYKGDVPGALVTDGHIKTAVAQAHSGVTVTAAAKTALKNIIFE